MIDELLALPPPPADRRVGYGPHSSRFLDLFLPSGAAGRPLVVAIHGGFWRARWDLSHLSYLCRFLAQQGFAVASLEYRRVGEEGGGHPGTFDDVLAGFRAACALPDVDARAPIVVGHSAGGHLALFLASRRVRPLAGIVSFAGMADLRRVFDLHLSADAVVELLGGDPESEPARYDDASPARHLPFGLPQLLVHGRADDCVPFEMSGEYGRFARAAGDAVDELFFDGGHYEPIDPRWAGQPAVLCWMRRRTEG